MSLRFLEVLLERSSVKHLGLCCVSRHYKTSWCADNRPRVMQTVGSRDWL